MSNELAPFHAGHKLVGALLWATSKFFDHARWENAPLPGIDHRHRPLPQFMRMADDHLWVLIHAMRDGQPDKVRISRGTGQIVALLADRRLLHRAHACTTRWECRGA